MVGTRMAIVAALIMARLGCADACPCFGDLDCDGATGIGDLESLINQWGPCDEECRSGCDADLSHDGIIGCDDLIVLLAIWGTCEQPVRGNKIMFLGDTQSFDAGAAQFIALGNWIEQRVACHGPFALLAHAGDWWDESGPPGEPAVVREHLVQPIRDTGIPWTLSVGNWEFDAEFGCGYPMNHQRRRGVDALTTALPMGLVDDQSWYVAGAGPDPACMLPCEDDAAYAHAIQFNLNGEEQLALILPFAATLNMLDWAVSFASLHEPTPVWIFTHAWLDQEGRLLTQQNDLAPSTYMCDQIQQGRPAGNRPMDPWNQGHGIWESHFRHIPNLRFIFCGHTHNFGPPAVAANCCMEGVHGNTVHQFVINGQSESQAGGNGFMYILTFDSTNTMVTVETWRPLEDPDHPSCNPESSCFTFEVSDCPDDCLPK